MKAIIALFLRLAALVSAEGSPSWEIMTLRQSCVDVHITDGHVLTATCANVQDAPPILSKVLSLDLNNCFANHHGKLEYVQNGLFGRSCNKCHIDIEDKNPQLVCECGTGLWGISDEQYVNSTYSLKDWRTIRLAGCPGVSGAVPGSCNLNMGCHNSDYMSERVEDKVARHFLA
ncbi:hypothetical protein F5Y14DRAFT_457098 [Nemania sp. NC0429]|nr:hypothetical protein F5Y14DRAFT_457098 [Nemania sp. NC0429]